MRNSDRLVTPGVVICFLVLVAGCVLATIYAVTWLTAHDRDPEPMLKLVGLAVTSAASAGGFLLQLVNRVTITKAERNNNELTREVAALNVTHREQTDRMASALYEVADALPRPVPRHALDETVVANMNAAPGPRGG